MPNVSFHRVRYSMKVPVNTGFESYLTMNLTKIKFIYNYLFDAFKALQLLASFHFSLTTILTTKRKNLYRK